MRFIPPCLALFFIGGLILSSVFLGGINITNGFQQASFGSVLTLLFLGLGTIFAPKSPRPNETKVPVGLWRRYFAMNLDFMIAASIFIPLSAILNSLIEFAASGVWQWSFQQADSDDNAIFILVCVMLFFRVMFYYCHKYSEVGKPTPGQYIMGYQIVPAPGAQNPDFKNRIWRSLLFAWLGPFAFFFTQGIKDGVYPWDKATQTRAVRTAS